MQADILQTTDPRDLGRRIQEARKARGLTQGQVAGHLDMARTTVTAIEKGERRVQPEELIRFASLLGRSIGDFFRRGTPPESFAVQFRATLPPGREIPPEIMPKVLEFQRLCEDYRELEEICGAPLLRKYPSPYAIDGVQPEEAAEDVASAERNRLGLGDGPIPNLRELLESSVGLRIFSMDDLPSQFAAMFNYSEELGGCIAINAKHPEVRRRMSLAHDYAHFLTRRYQPELSIAGMYARNPLHERFADAFARTFLMPAIGVSRQFHEIRRSRGGVTPTAADVLTMAYHYFVSMEAMTRRLEELRLLPSGTWERLRERGFRVQEAQQRLGLTPRAETDALFPMRYWFLAVEALVEREELTEKQFADFLRIDWIQGRRIAEEFENSRRDSEESLSLALDDASHLAHNA